MLETFGLSKRFGDLLALRDCSLSIAAGGVVGLLGPNGAGKTTLIRLLLGYLFPTSGRATVGGFDTVTQSVQVRRQISYLPGDARLPSHLRGHGVLEFFAGIQPDGDLPQSLRIAERLELDLRRRVAFMSTGMRQKLALAVVLGARTPLLILDEPTANLDPTVRAQVLQMVGEARREGRTVLLCSHILSEIEESCDRALLLRQGELVRELVLSELKQRHRIVARAPRGVPRLPDPWKDQLSIATDPQRPDRVVIDTAGDLAPLLPWLSTLGLEAMRVEPFGLHTVYNEVHHPSELEGATA